MDLFRIFIWFLKEKEVLCEFRKIYTEYSLGHNYQIFDHENRHYKTVMSMPFNECFSRVIKNSYSIDRLKCIFYEVLPYSWVDKASTKLLNASKRWEYFVKNNILISNEINTNDVLTISDDKVKFLNYPPSSREYVIKDVIPKWQVKVKGVHYDTILPLMHFDEVNGKKIEYYIKRRNKIYKGNAKTL